MENETREEKKISLKMEVIDKLFTLLISAFGLVAALAWNDAIQALFRFIFGEQSSLIAKFAYATIVTAVIVVVTIRFGHISKRIRSRFESM